MKSKEIRKWASRNCPYKKFKWHTDEMCKNCTKDAEEIEALVEKDRQDLLGSVMGEICDEKDAAEDMGLLDRILGRKSSVQNALDSLKMRIKKIGE